MRTLKIPFPDISFYEKTRLVDPNPEILTIPANTQQITLRNLAGFSANDYLVIEAFESEDAEIVQIATIDSVAKIIQLTNPTVQEHASGVIAFKTPYDKFRVYKGTAADPATHVLLGTAQLLRPDNPYTYSMDATGTDANYYSYTYYNTTTTLETSRVAYVQSDYDSVLSVKQLKEWFMFGLDLTDDDGYPFPNSMFEFAIRAAIDSLEHTLQVDIVPKLIVDEQQDYWINEYRDFCFIQLYHYPILSVQRFAIKYPTASSMIEFPLEWVQPNLAHGQIHLIPTSGSISNILMGQGGDYLNFVWRGLDFMPNLFHINYTAGFTQVPNDIIGVIGKMACFYPLNIAGDLVGGVAIASKSIGIDGLSQSINTTLSPENAGYSARLREYERELKIEIPRLVAYYKGLRMAVA